MMRQATLLRLLLALFLCALPGAARAQSLIIDYVGFDYESPSFGSFGQVGAGYVGVGLVPGVFLPLVSDSANNQYTYVVSGMHVVSRTVVGTHVIIAYSPGTLAVYEDSKASGTPAVFAPNPPNGQVPGTFTDGSLYLSGTLTNFAYILNLANGSGSYEADCVWDAGAHLGDIPGTDRNGWTFAGTTTNAVNIPQGWSHQVDGQNFITTPTVTRRSSWGGLKTQYR